MTSRTGTSIVGLFGKMPAHGDFVRRGLPPRVAQRLDDWLQGEFGRAPDPAVAIAALLPLRLASVDIEPGTLALGAMISSYDKIGRCYPLMAVRLSTYAASTVPEHLPAVWKDWCREAERQLLAARDDSSTADAALANIDPNLPSTTEGISDTSQLGTWTWRSASLLEKPAELCTDGLPRGVDFDRLMIP